MTAKTTAAKTNKQAAKRGRPFERPARPDIRVTAAYASKIGAECGRIADTLDDCRGALLAVDRYLAEEIQRAAARLHEIQEIFQ